MFRSLRACALSTGFWSTPIPSTRRVCFPLLAPPPPPPPAALEVLLLPPQAASADAAAKPPTAVAPLNRTSRRVTPEPPSASSGGASSTTLILIRCSSPQANAHARVHHGRRCPPPKPDRWVTSAHGTRLRCVSVCVCIPDHICWR